MPRPFTDPIAALPLPNGGGAGAFAIFELGGYGGPDSPVPLGKVGGGGTVPGGFGA